MRSDISERDRHERVHELVGEPAGAEAPADASRPEYAEPVEARHEEHRPDQAEHERRLERMLRRQAAVLEELRDVWRDAVPGPLSGETVERDRPDHHRHQRHGPW